MEYYVDYLGHKSSFHSMRPLIIIPISDYTIIYALIDFYTQFHLRVNRNDLMWIDLGDVNGKHYLYAFIKVNT